MQRIDTRNPAACGAAYTSILGWPIAPGHRHRPRGGCTCGNPETCPGSGAHPLPGPLTPSPADGLAAELDASPGAALIAPTVPFDALVLPRWTGLSVVMWIARRTTVPCLLQGEDHAVLLVLPATGRYAVPEGTSPSTVQVRSGPEQWIALPPSHGARWDTPPWHEQTQDPLPLIPGGDLLGALASALRATAEPSGAQL
ncbi:hypothetical protein FE633_11190 [Streptomyces montanus]|uniref:DNA primase n=1 Tax=Streptomyces montanus TaxID=2580423 RepID=A0A5R9FQA7_9ACTN|nr:hypothetical protein [Streptomyces montanus]TLS46102.1 hypothetical protein FE633_11190 [Streptomyces montanus]